MLPVAACGGADGPPAEARVPGGGLAVRVAPPDLVLVNRDTAAIYYTVFEREMTALVNWRPCVDPAACRGVAPGAEHRLPLDSIPGYSPAATGVLVYWWHLVPGDGGAPGFDSVRSRVVELRSDTAFQTAR